MKLEASHLLRVPREKVWSFITTPDSIGRCIPGIKQLNADGPDRFTCVLSAGIGFIKEDFTCLITISDRTEPSQVRLRGSGKGARDRVDIDALIELTDVTEGTQLKYQADVMLSGGMLGLAQRVIGSATEKMVNDLFKCIRHELEESRSE